MKTLIVYYSQEGSTRYIAQRLAAALEGELLELKPVKEYPKKGLMKYAAGGFAAGIGAKPALEPYECPLEEAELVILGSPVWNSRVTPPLNTFLAEHDLAGKQVAAFACHAGGGPDKLFKALEEKVGKLAATAAFQAPKERSSDADKEIERFVSALKKLG